MGCGCNKNRGGNRFKVELPGGLIVTKATEAEATAYAAKHPGAKVKSPAA